MPDNKPVLNTVLDIKEAVEFFNGKFSEWMLRQMVNKGEIPHFRQGNKKILFDADELKLWWENKIKQSMQPKQIKSSGYGTIRKIHI